MWRTSRVGGGSHDGRWPAWAGALVTSILLLGTSAWRGGLDLYGASAALLAIAAFAFWPARPQRTSTTEGPATATNLSDELVARFPDPLILVDRRAVVVVANDRSPSPCGRPRCWRASPG
jgi:two-component system phosphate regulon sensor histidine kinase PhoR